MLVLKQLFLGLLLPAVVSGGILNIREVSLF